MQILMCNFQRISGYSQSHKFYFSKSLFMMRLNVKVALVFIMTIVVSTIIILYSVCGQKDRNWNSLRSLNGKSYELQMFEEIDCDINGKFVVGCRKEGDEVYVPFSFLHRYFEIYGKLTTFDGMEKFEWSHSYSKVYHPKSTYDPKGVFMYFENYNVEVRERVKCVCGMEGVPVSTQWEVQGYYYPTQIAQFGLSHYSKNLTEPEPRRKVIDDSEQNVPNWTVPKFAIFDRIHDNSLNTQIIKFSSYDTVGINLKVDHVLYFVMSFDIKMKSNSSLTVTLQNRESNEVYNLHYLTSDTWIAAQGNNIYHGIGSSSVWKKLTRDLITDLQKGIAHLDKERTKHKISRSKMKISHIFLHGDGAIDNLTLSSSEHMKQFYSAAEWFLKHQDLETGGWAIPVKRKLAAGFQDLQPGWFSSMGQGHAISVLSRAYYHSRGDFRFLTAALRGLRPFKVLSSKGGVKATFFNEFVWYEEYPTKPPSFVLNGFIYSLLGLYDLIAIAPAGQAQEAEDLYKEGMNSLKNMLTLFDMGSITSYDLRHFTIGTAPNLARWDYHATHVNQLLLLSTIENETIFRITAERWLEYMNGKKANHN